MKLYTRNGDRGYTTLCGGRKIAKNHPLIDIMGQIDELVSSLAVVADSLASQSIINQLVSIQKRLMYMAMHIAGSKGKKIKKQDVVFLENAIDRYGHEVSELKGFIIPGGHTASSFCHIARCTSRKLERNMADMMQIFDKQGNEMAFINRLSDF